LEILARRAVRNRREGNILLPPCFTGKANAKLSSVCATQTTLGHRHRSQTGSGNRLSTLAADAVIPFTQTLAGALNLTQGTFRLNQQGLENLIVLSLAGLLGEILRMTAPQIPAYCLGAFAVFRGQMFQSSGRI